MFITRTVTLQAPAAFRTIPVRVAVHTFVEFDLTDTVSPRLVDKPAHFNSALFAADFFEADNVTEHDPDEEEAPGLVVVEDIRLKVPTDENT